MFFQSPVVWLVMSLFFVSLFPFTPMVDALKYVFDKETKVCFVEEITSDTMFITGRYNWHDRSVGSINLNLVLYGPNSEPIKTLGMKSGENIFAIPIPSGASIGGYLLCAEIVSPIKYKPNAMNPPIMVSFDVDQSYTSVLASPPPQNKNRTRKTVDGMDVFSFRDSGGEMKAILRPKEYLQNVEKDIARINEEIQVVGKNMVYELQRESRMRKTSESTFTRVWIASLLTLGVMILTVFAQFYSLKSIIIKKKLV